MTHSTLIETWFTKPNPERGPIFKWGFLVVVLALFAFGVALAIIDSPLPPIRWAQRFAMPLVLLLNHLAFSFPWHGSRLVVMRSLAYAGLITAIILLLAGR